MKETNDGKENKLSTVRRLSQGRLHRRQAREGDRRGLNNRISLSQAAPTLGTGR